MAPFVKPAASATSSRLPSSTPRSASTRRPASSSSTRVSLLRLARMIPIGIKDTAQNPNRQPGDRFWGSSAVATMGTTTQPPRVSRRRSRDVAPCRRDVVARDDEDEHPDDRDRVPHQDGVGTARRSWFSVVASQAAGCSHEALRPSVGGGCEATARRALDWGGSQSMFAIRPRERGEETTEDAHAVHHRGTLHRPEGPLLRRRVSGGLHLRGGGPAVHSPGRVHRLRGLRAGVPGHGDLPGGRHSTAVEELHRQKPGRVPGREPAREADRKSTRLNSSHGYISYAVFCLKKKKKNTS